MDGQADVAFDIDTQSNSVAYSSSDGVIRVWEADTANLKNEFLPSAHLSATCTCIKWRPVRTQLNQVCYLLFWLYGECRLCSVQ